MAITFSVLDQFQESKVFQTAQAMSNILKLNTKWWLCHHGNCDLLRLIASLATAHKNHLNCLTVTISL